jgi:hypothetical protein
LRGRARDADGGGVAYEEERAGVGEGRADRGFEGDDATGAAEENGLVRVKLTVSAAAGRARAMAATATMRMCDGGSGRYGSFRSSLSSLDFCSVS